MKRIHIFKAGTHTDMGGKTLVFGEEELRAAAAAYDPDKHEAPLVVGHPRADLPAYGWVKALQFADGGLHAVPDQIDPAFGEMVEAGRFKKVSASFYLPTAPGNPVPGTYYLRHVGFLGAQPPAVKGLKAVAFAEDAGTVTVEFGDWGDRAVARVLRRLKNFWIGKFGQDEADWLIDEYDLESITEEALRSSPRAELVSPAFAEGKEPGMTPEEMQRKEQELLAREAALNERQAAFAEQEQRLVALEAENQQIKETAAAAAREARAAEFAAFCEQLPTRITPALRPAVIAQMQALDGLAAVDFAEADGTTVQKTPLAIYQEQLKALPEVVAFGEHVTRQAAGEAVDLANPEAIAAKALAFQEEQAKAGLTITITEAVAHVTRQ